MEIKFINFTCGNQPLACSTKTTKKIMDMVTYTKHVYLNDTETRQLMKLLNKFFESKVEIPRIHVGKKQTVETLINEEALLFSKYLRNETKIWTPRILS